MYGFRRGREAVQVRGARPGELDRPFRIVEWVTQNFDSDFGDIGRSHR
jgi:hypothetical protein